MATTDSFGTSQDFIAQQQAKRLANEQAKAMQTAQSSQVSTAFDKASANNATANVTPNVNTNAGATVPVQNATTMTTPTITNSNPWAAVPNVSVGTKNNTNTSSLVGPDGLAPKVAPTPWAPTPWVLAPSSVPNAPTETTGTSLARADVALAEQQRKAAATELATQKATTEANVAAQTTATENLNAQTEAARVYAEQQKQLLQQRSQELSNQMQQYTAMKQLQADKATETVQPLVDNERINNKAQIDQATAANEQAIYQAGIDNDILAQQSNVAFQKLGLAMSTAAVNTSQQIWKQGALAIAKLKADGAVNIAELRMKTGQIEVDHQLKVNAIIDNAQNDIFTFRANTEDAIAKIKSDIILTDKQKADSIAKLKADYSQKKIDLQSDLVSKIRGSNSELETKLVGVRNTLQLKQTDGQNKVMELIKGGQWDSLTPAMKQQYASDAGQSISQIEATRTSTVYSAVNAGLAAYLPGTIISPASAAKIFNYAQSLVATGIPLDVAIGKSIQANATSLPEYAEYVNYTKRLKEAELAQKQATVGLTGAQTQAQLANAQQSLATADYTKAGKSSMRYDLTQDPITGDWIKKDKMTGNAVVVNPYDAAAMDRVDVATSPDEVISYSVDKRGKENLQCGELVNDYIKQQTGTDPSGAKRVWNTYNSKVEALNKIGKSDTPVVGGIFVSNPLGNDVGHTGIVQAVHPDGSIDVIEANATGKSNGDKPIIKTYKSTSGMMFSEVPSAGGKVDTKSAESLISEAGIKTPAQVSQLRNQFIRNAKDTSPEEAKNILTQQLSGVSTAPSFDPAIVTLKDKNSTAKSLDELWAMTKMKDPEQFAKAIIANAKDDNGNPIVYFDEDNAPTDAIYYDAKKKKFMKQSGALGFDDVVLDLNAKK